jgi:sensor histidine kinase YesM
MYPSTGKQTSEYGNCFKYLCIFLRIVCITYICALFIFLVYFVPLAYFFFSFFFFFLPTIKTRKFLQRLKIRKIISDNIKKTV